LHEPGVEMHPSDRKTIWRVFWILLGITVVELVLAGSFGKTMGLRFILIAMTLVKAFYIVGYFMHLKFERANMIMTIIIPLIFIIGAIISVLFEANYWGLVR